MLTQRGLFSLLNILLLKKPKRRRKRTKMRRRRMGRRRRSKAKGTWMASWFNLRGRIMEFKNLLLICVTLQKREKKECPLKEQQKQKVVLFFPIRFSLYLLPFPPYATRKKEFCIPSFLHHSLWGGRSISWLCDALRHSETLRCYLEWNCFSSRKHLLIKNSICVELKLISLFKSK